MDTILMDAVARALGSLEGWALLLAVGAVATWLWWRRRQS